VERAAHQRGAHDLARLQRSYEVGPAEALEARPEADERWSRLLRLKTGKAPDRLDGADRRTCEQQLARERRAIELPGG
jgi:hypothetical protein